MATSPLTTMATGSSMCHPFSQGALLAFSTNNFSTARQRYYVKPNVFEDKQWVLHATPPSAQALAPPYHQTMRGRRPINASPIHNIRYSEFLMLIKQRRIEKVC